MGPPQMVENLFSQSFSGGQHAEGTGTTGSLLDLPLNLLALIITQVSMYAL